MGKKSGQKSGIEKIPDLLLRSRLSALKEGDFAVIVAPTEKSKEASLEALRSFEIKGLNGVYISFQEGYFALLRMFLQPEISKLKVVFIDCISQTYMLPVLGTEQVSYLETPIQLDVIQSHIEKMVQKIPGKKFIFLDSITAMLCYNTGETAFNFLKSLIKAAKEMNLLTVSVLNEGFESKEIIQKLGEIDNEEVVILPLGLKK